MLGPAAPPGGGGRPVVGSSWCLQLHRWSAAPACKPWTLHLKLRRGNACKAADGHTRLLRCEHSQPRTESNVHVEEERLTALPMKTGGDQNPRTPWTPSRGPVLWSALRPPCSSGGPRCPAGRWGGPRSRSLAWGAVAERAQRQLLTQHVAQGLQEQQVGRTERPDGAWPAQLWGRA